MMELATFQLPGGLLEPSGAVHRDGQLRPLTGADEDWLGGLAPSSSLVELVTSLLERCVERIGPHAMTRDRARELSVGDRDYLVFKLCEVSIGPSLARVVTCPHCGERMDLALAIAEFPLEVRAMQPSHALEVDGIAVAWRVPRGCEQEMLAAMPAASTAVLHDALLEACVLQLRDGEGAAVAFEALSTVQRQALATAIEAAAPRVELDVELVCPDCARAFELAFDPATVLLQELGGRAALERELHVLASHYHWSLDALLALSRPRRQRFLQLIAGRA